MGTYEGFFSANKSNFLEDLTKLSGNVVSGVRIKFTNRYIGDSIFVGIAHVCARRISPLKKFDVFTAGYMYTE